MQPAGGPRDPGGAGVRGPSRIHEDDLHLRREVRLPPQVWK